MCIDLCRFLFQGWRELQIMNPVILQPHRFKWNPTAGTYISHLTKFLQFFLIGNWHPKNGIHCKVCSQASPSFCDLIGPPSQNHVLRHLRWILLQGWIYFFWFMSGRNMKVLCSLWLWLRILSRINRRASRRCRHLCRRNSWELFWLVRSIIGSHRTMDLSTPWFPKDFAAGSIYLLYTMPHQEWSRRGRWRCPSMSQIMNGCQVSCCLMSCCRFRRSW